MNIFDWVVFGTIVLHLIAGGVYWFFIHSPYLQIKARLEHLERCRSAVQDSNHHHGPTPQQRYDELTKIRNKKRKKREQKKRLQYLYLVVAVPISAGIIALAYAIKSFLN